MKSIRQDDAVSVRISVIIPTYNAERYIQQTIDSVLNQSFSDLEVVVVDDGSTDRTCELVEAYPQRVRLFRQRNQGVCRARNHGLSHARGEFICFLDHDDFWHPEKLSMQVPFLDADTEVGVVFSTFQPWTADAQGDFAPAISLLAAPLVSGVDERFSGWIYHEFLMDCWALTSTALIRASALHQVGAFDESLPYSEDWELWIRLSRQCKFVKLKANLVLYRQHASQGSRMARPIDYRTRLLQQSQERWGLASRDGRAITHAAFMRNLSLYQAEYGLHQLRSGNPWRAFQSFWLAWCKTPVQPKYLAYIVAGLLGWRPKF